MIIYRTGAAAPKAPLCKGSWHGEAVTEGLLQKKVANLHMLPANS